MSSGRTEEEGRVRVPEELLQGLAALERMQAAQGEALAAGDLQALVVWQEERAELFRGLIAGFDRLPGTAALPGVPALLGLVRERLGTVLENERELFATAAQQKDHLQQRLHAMRKGKKALHGYTIHQGMAPGPRFLRKRA